jgi:hypothetical protein
MAHFDEPMTTMEDAHAESAAYWGDQGEWLIVLAQTRDSDPMERSNFLAAAKQLGAVFHGPGDADAPTGDALIQRSGHWACGWVEYLIVRPGTDAEKTAKGIRAELADYPILDEESFSEMEYEDAETVWRDCMDWRDRAEKIREDLGENTRDGYFRELMLAVRGDFSVASEFLSCPTEIGY